MVEWVVVWSMGVLIHTVSNKVLDSSKSLLENMSVNFCMGEKVQLLLHPRFRDLRSGFFAKRVNLHRWRVIGDVLTNHSPMNEFDVVATLSRTAT
jgi:hypothetical protein